jgi:hypothetical protein
LNSDNANSGSLYVYTLKDILLSLLLSASKLFLNVKVVFGSSSTIRIRLANGGNSGFSSSTSVMVIGGGVFCDSEEKEGSVTGSFYTLLLIMRHHYPTDRYHSIHTP